MSARRSELVSGCCELLHISRVLPSRTYKPICFRIPCATRRASKLGQSRHGAGCLNTCTARSFRQPAPLLQEAFFSWQSCHSLWLASRALAPYAESVGRSQLRQLEQALGLSTVVPTVGGMGTACWLHTQALGLPAGSCRSATGHHLPWDLTACVVRVQAGPSVI